MTVPRLVPMDLAMEPATLEEIRRSVRAGGVLAIPTDTFYGLAADPLSEAAIGRIFALKGRSAAQALPVVVASAAQLAELGVQAPDAILAKLEAIWPAPLTAVLPITRPIAASGGARTLAVRVPALASLRALLASIGPLTATSANRSGFPPARNASQALEACGSGIDFVLDGGGSESTLPSTLVDLTKSPPEILRSGAFSWS